MREVMDCHRSGAARRHQPPAAASGRWPSAAVRRGSRPADAARASAGERWPS